MYTPILVGIEGLVRGRKFSVTGEKTSIGRKNCDVMVPREDDSVSRSHCAIYRKGAKYQIADNGSTNAEKSIMAALPAGTQQDHIPMTNRW